MKKAKKNKIISGKPHYWEDACDYLARKDKVLGKIIATYKGEGPMRKSNAFHTLARSIVGQQISVKAADSVWAKLEKAAKGKIEPKIIAKLTDNQLRSCGLSEMKVNYMRNVANFFVNDMAGKIDLIDHDHLEIAGKLIEIKGIGKWTVDMFMIFHMHAADVFPMGDLGLVNAVKKHYKLTAKSLQLTGENNLSSRAKALVPKPRDLIYKRDSSTTLRSAQNDKKMMAAEKKELMKQIEKLGEKWKPYRTVATWYLWRSLDPVPVEY